jgi:iron donor protein CyaY
MKILVPKPLVSGNLEILALTMKDAAEFRKHSEDALHVLYRSAATAGDDFGFEAEFDSGVLSIDFGKPNSRLVVSPHLATHQIWISAARQLQKLRWDVVENTFVLDATGETLKDLLEQAISRQVGEDVSL